MSNTDPNNPEFPLPWNVNLTQFVGMIVFALGYFGILVPDKVAHAIVAVVPPLVFLITFVMHTLVNHPANLRRVQEVARLALIQGRAQAHTMIVMFLSLAFLLGACATTGGGSNANVDNVAKSAVILVAAQSTFLQDCTGPGALSWCKGANKTQVKVADASAVAALQTAAAAAKLNSTDPTSMGKLIVVLVSDLQVVQNDINALQAKSGRKAVDATVIIQIAEVAIQVGLQVYAEIVALQQNGGASTAQLDSLVNSAVANDQQIQAL